MNWHFVSFLVSTVIGAVNVAFYAADTTRWLNLGAAIICGALAIHDGSISVAKTPRRGGKGT